MSVSDPIADFLTVVRNGVRARKANVEVPFSKIKAAISQILAEEGFIDGWETIEVASPKGGKHRRLKLALRYADELKRVSPLNQLERVSSPGRRVYVTRGALPRVRGGFGVSILSTSHGVISDRTARKYNVGGELLLQVW